MDILLEEAVERFLAERCDPGRVREIEADGSGGAADALWAELSETGFADALVAEHLGGSGLALADAAAIAFACGRHAVPVPLSLTMSVRAALSGSGSPPPPGSITVADSVDTVNDGTLAAKAVPYGAVADWVLLPLDSGSVLLPGKAARRIGRGGHGCQAADLSWPAPGAHDAIRLPESDGERVEWTAIAAALVAGQIAGAMERVVEMTIEYAKVRSQFGQPIGKRQAIQQQISVMVEQSFAGRSAALVALSGRSWRVDAFRAGVAKSRAGEAAAFVAAGAHAVHGAIGLTEEYDLQILTRRLHEWRAAYGGQQYWNRRLGQELLDGTFAPLEFLRRRLAATDGAHD
ncbi:MAG: acyl-CoA dehydrogenase [Burkholderiaceae bacterium]|nr:acyl-CoA dehydrogenase [Burkholderiaceae bacterium]